MMNAAILFDEHNPGARIALKRAHLAQVERVPDLTRYGASRHCLLHTAQFGIQFTDPIVDWRLQTNALIEFRLHGRNRIGIGKQTNVSAIHLDGKSPTRPYVEQLLKRLIKRARRLFPVNLLA
jgi:hypothetical protein